MDLEERIDAPGYFWTKGWQGDMKHIPYMSSTEKTNHILVVDDEPSTAEFLSDLLVRGNYKVTTTFSLKEAVAAIENNSFSVIVSDLCLGGSEGTALLPQLKAIKDAPPIIFITGFGSVDTAVASLHEGAFDYISKPTDLRDIGEDLLNVVGRAVKHREALMHSSTTDLQMAPVSLARTMVGTSPAMVKVYRALAKAALSRENVLIFGESGTGKELVARAIHEKSPWHDKPFVTVNCCALTETLLESELFGHIRGSFTGATQNKKGLFEEADGGTLFLDEIGDVSLALQVKLLRAIQEGEIKPVGSNETRKVDVRLVAATHRDLNKHVHEGKFREDLYYRLKVVMIEMPPLRDRKKDIPELVQYFITRYVARTAKQIKSVAGDAMTLLLNYPWPGNIRELENAISQAATMSSTSVLFPEDFPPEVLGGGSHGSMSGNAEAPKEAAPLVIENSVGESLEELEKKHIARTLESVNFNKSKAAEILGIDRVTLYRKAFKYGILAKASRPAGTT